MKKIFLIFFLLAFKIHAQTEVSISYPKPAFLMSFKDPYKEIRLDFEDDYKGFYAKMDVSDSLMVFRSKNEFKKYTNEVEKYKKAVERAIKEKEEEEKELKEGKAKKSSKNKKEVVLTPPDKTTYLIINRELLKPGLELEVTYQEYRSSKKLLVTTIVITTDLDKKATYEGIFEKLDGDIATIDGKAVKLVEKAQIKGKKGKGFEGKVFNSFKEMMLGSIVEVNGRRQADGVLLAEKGEVWENSEDDLDRQIKVSLKNTMRMSANEVAFGDSKFQLIKNPAIQTYVSKVGRSLIPQYQKELHKDHPAKIDFNFYVIKDSTFNACAYPDGSIFVHSTLLEEIENEAQLAAILGHEMAHVTYEHSKKNFETNKNIKLGKEGVVIIGKIIDRTTNTSIPVADLSVMVASFGGQALSSKYSRDLESQADRNGLTYMINAGYDPREAAKIWKRLSTLSDKNEPEYHYGSDVVRAVSKGIETIYASHPDANNRYKSLNRLLAQNLFTEELEDKTIGKDEYTAFKKGLKNVLKGKAFDEPVYVAPKKEETKPVDPKPATDTKPPANKPPTKPKAQVKKKPND
ncbi:M48 family metalloprotease [Emticicia sp. 17c]|uniref:M48 family metalloprotease n=1 Tax=Emticicia sp. 17c TaxID=3127704 RepID=UPI00301D229E